MRTRGVGFRKRVASSRSLYRERYGRQPGLAPGSDEGGASCSPFDPLRGEKHECRRLTRGRGSRDPYLELTRFGVECLAVAMGEGEILARQFEGDLLGAARREKDLAERLELAHRPDSTGDAVVDVELHHFFADDVA